jgi:hypothetical protein
MQLGRHSSHLVNRQFLLPSVLLHALLPITVDNRPLKIVYVMAYLIVSCADLQLELLKVGDGHS